MTLKSHLLVSSTALIHTLLEEEEERRERESDEM
jgi:hypothetical protein